MTRNKLFSVLAIIALAAAIGFGTDAFAGKGRGGVRAWCDDPGYGPGAAYGRSGAYAPGYPYDGGNLTEAQAKAMDDENRAFFDATNDLRNRLRQKGLELRSEMAKEKVDVENAKKLQKEISALNGQLGEKRIDHMVKMREIDPSGAGRGFGHPGMGQRGRGSSGRGGYWN